MGVLRILLASLVLASHAGFAPVMSGVLAVECFFVISGFYMQMIITEQYSSHIHWRRNFLTSRFLRIFVPYWVILLGIIGITYARKHTILLNHDMFSLFSNIFIIGSEHIKLWRLAEGCGAFYWQQLVIPTVWSVGIELLFYLAAPLLLPCRNRTLAVITLVSLIGKGYMLTHYAEAAFNLECGDGLINGIFPLEIGMFTLGAFLYRFYKYYLAEKQGINYKRYYTLLAVLFICTKGMVNALAYDQVPAIILPIWYGYIGFLALLIPFLFKASRFIRTDRRIGDLSYPFYLCHFYIVSDILGNSALSKSPKFLLAEMMTLIAAFAIHWLIEKPLDKIRHRYFT